MRKEIHIALRKTPKNSLPHVWADLFMNIKTEHSYGLPADLNEEERTEIMSKIREEVGMKACWREFLKRNGWTDQLFEDWWASSTEKKLYNYLSQNSSERAEYSGSKNHPPFMIPLSAFFGCFIGQLLVRIIFRILEIS